MKEPATKIFSDAIVIDATSPLAQHKEYYKRYIEGGFTVCCPTVVDVEPMDVAFRRLGAWHKRFKEKQKELLLITSVKDIYKAKEEGKLGIILAFQDTGTAIQNDLNMLELYYKLGVRIIQLCYNSKNFVGDGCIERTDSGLSNFGIMLIEEMNRLGIVIDISHTGYKTTMDAIELSTTPIIFSHSNVYSICPNKRNIKDDQIISISKKGGVIGLNSMPFTVSTKKNPTVHDFADHIDYIKNLVGIDHIAMGMDYYEYMWGVVSDEEALEKYHELVSAGIFDPSVFPPFPYKYAEGIEIPEKFSNLVPELLKRNYTEEEIKKVLGLNLLRVFSDIWND